MFFVFHFHTKEEKRNAAKIRGKIEKPITEFQFLVSLKVRADHCFAQTINQSNLDFGSLILNLKIYKPK